MKISGAIELLKAEMDETGDGELNIYNSHGDRIEPTGLGHGCRVGSDGHVVDTVYFSDLD